MNSKNVQTLKKPENDTYKEGWKSLPHLTGKSCEETINALQKKLLDTNLPQKAKKIRVANKNEKPEFLNKENSDE